MPITVDEINTFVEGVWPDSRSRCVAVSANEAVAVLTTAREDLRPGGYISGPTQFAVADVALWFLVFGAIDRIEPMALTCELSLRFLRPAIGTKLFARARLDRAGRRTVVATMTIWTDNNEARPSATAQGTYMLP